MKNLTKNLVTLTLTAAAAFMLLPQSTQAHCQVPCGIYDDAARVTAMLEDAATVKKAVKLIGELSGKTDAQSQNQIVRWVTNKEKHATYPGLKLRVYLKMGNCGLLVLPPFMLPLPESSLK